MPEVLEIIPDGEGAIDGLKKILADGRLTHVLGLPGGMRGGRPSVAFVVQSMDGSEALLGQTSLRLFLEAADEMRRVHGDPRRADAKGGSA